MRGRSRLVTLQGEPPKEAADFASAFASAPSTAPDLYEHPPADGADGADAKSGAQSCGGAGALRVDEAGAETGAKADHSVSLEEEAQPAPKGQKLTFDEMCEMIDKAGIGLSGVDGAGQQQSQAPQSDYDRYLADDEDEP